MRLFIPFFLKITKMVFFHSREGAIKLKLQSEEKDESLESFRILLTYRQQAGERQKDRK